MAKYDELDEMILASLGDRPKSFSDIRFGAEYASPNINPTLLKLAGEDDDPARILDRRLQALRKKGLIYHSNGWLLVPF